MTDRGDSIEAMRSLFQEKEGGVTICDDVGRTGLTVGTVPVTSSGSSMDAALS